MGVCGDEFGRVGWWVGVSVCVSLGGCECVCVVGWVWVGRLWVVGRCEWVCLWGGCGVSVGGGWV